MRYHFVELGRKQRHTVDSCRSPEGVPVVARHANSRNGRLSPTALKNAGTANERMESHDLVNPLGFKLTGGLAGHIACCPRIPWPSLPTA